MLLLSSTCGSEKLQARNQARKAAHGAFKPDNSVDESFEDLLSKYKQIQLELECIRKEETMALEPKVSPARDVTPASTASVPDAKPAQEAAPSLEELSEQEVAEKKAFQAFNIRPLRHKLPNPANLDCAEQDRDREGGAEKEGERNETRYSVPLMSDTYSAVIF